MSRNSKRILVTAACITGAAIVIMGLAANDARAYRIPLRDGDRTPVSALRLQTASQVQASSHAPSQASSRATAQAQIQLDMATLHAAALSKARTIRDSLDAPYLLVTVLGPGSAQTSMQMPAAGKHWSIRQDEAKGAATLTSVVVQPGDSVRVLFTLLEADQVDVPSETAVGTALTKLDRSAVLHAKSVAPALASLTNRGTNWIGSAAMLLTNQGGKPYWHALDCVSTCKVSNSPLKSAAGTELTASATAAVLEFNGNTSTYHLQVTAKRAM